MGHVFVECLVGGGAPEQKLCGIIEGLRPLPRVTVLHLMIVPGDERRDFGVNSLQIPVKPVLRIAIAVGGESLGFDAIAMTTHRIGRITDALVDVVPEEQHDIRVFVGQMPVSREIAMLIVGAGHKAEPQTLRSASEAGRVSACPMGLCAEPLLNRYQ